MGGPAARNDVLQDLVDEVDVGQRRVGVGAAQLDVADVAAPARYEEGLAEFLVVDEGQDVDEVGGRAQHRLAVLAAAIIDVAEQRPPVRQVGIVRRKALEPVADGRTVDAREENARHDAAHRRAELGVQGFRRRRPQRGPADQGLRLLLADAVLEHGHGGAALAGDRPSRGQAALQQRLQRRIALARGRDRAQPMEGLERLPETGFVRHALQRTGVPAQVGVRARACHLEVGIALEEGEQVALGVGRARDDVVAVLGQARRHEGRRKGVLDDGLEHLGVGLPASLPRSCPACRRQAPMARPSPRSRRSSASQSDSLNLTRSRAVLMPSRRKASMSGT